MTPSSHDNLLNIIKKWHIGILLVIIVIIGAYLRLSHFESLARFNADQVRDTQIVTAMIEDNKLPLLGPKAGGTKFKLGPAFYYLEYASAKAFGATAVGISIIVPLLGIFSIILFFYLVRFYFVPHMSLMLTFLYAISFYAVRYSRFAWNPNLIPFFLFAYLITLLKILQAQKKHLTLWYILAGITIGIGSQLHTTLLILMPLTFIILQIYLYTRDKTITIKHILLTIAITLFFHTPTIIYDIQNNGKNITSFFYGTQTKTEESISMIERIGKTGQFFVQGNIYALTGIEPRRNWMNPKKLVIEKEYGEIVLAFFGTIFFIAGLFFTFKKIQTEKCSQKKSFLLLITIFCITTFTLFFFIAGELNLRFFIVILFLPFVLFGIITQHLIKHFKKNKLIQIGIACTVFILTFSNLAMYKKAYDFSDLTTRESLYGGISIRESKEIAQFITNTQSQIGKEKRHLLPFSYARSVKFFTQKNGDTVTSIKIDKLRKDMTIFLITKNRKDSELPQEYTDCFSVLDFHTLDRFSIFALQKENSNCSI